MVQIETLPDELVGSPKGDIIRYLASYTGSGNREEGAKKNEGVLQDRPDKEPTAMNIGKKPGQFLSSHWKSLLLPAVVVIVLLGALLIFSNGNAIAPTLYQKF